MKSCSHTMIQIPEGKSVQDLLPVFSNVKHCVGPINSPAHPVCACCKKRITATRRSELTLRAYSSNSPVPVGFDYQICRECEFRYRAGGVKRDRVLAAVQNFMMGGS